MAVDLFRRIVITGTQQGQNLSAGAGLGSNDDYLIHALEQRIIQEGRSISQNEAASVVDVQVLDDASFWAMATDIDVGWLNEIIGDTTTLNPAVKSAQFWSFSTNGDISVFGE